MRILKIILAVYLLTKLLGPDEYSFLYAVLNQKYIENREIYLTEESNLFSEQISHYAMNRGSSVYRESITRRVGTGYRYEIDREDMINQCENVMAGMGWNLEEKYDKKQDGKKIMVFKREGYICEMIFLLDKNTFRTMMETDDIYRTLSM